MTGPDPTRLTPKELAARTPADRDRYVDLLRALSIAVVVLGHWLMAAVYLRAGRITGVNALDVVPGLWITTWLLQVMPLFFFVGGFSNFVSWRSARRRGRAYADFLRSRIERLMRPTIVFVAVWLLGAWAMGTVSPRVAAELQPALAVIARPLWFLGVYVLVVALSPVMVRLHLRFRTRVPIALAAGAGAVDVLRVGFGFPAVGYANFALVWLFAHQLGFFYADGTLVGASVRRHLVMAFAGLAALTVLTTVGPYSPSMVGMGGEGASNNSPPSVCLIVLSLWLVGIAMGCREPARRLLVRPRAWAAVVAANSVIMTAFLWHLTVLLVAVPVLSPLGFFGPEVGSARWWMLRPAWVAVLCVLLVPFVVALSRFERPPARPSAPARASRLRLAWGLAMLVAGLSLLAQYGFDPAATPSPWAGGALAGAGYALVRRAGRQKAVA